MDNVKKPSQKIIYIFLILIIIAGIARYSYAFFVEKQGTHSDEGWSFGLANSYYEPFIYSTDNRVYSKNANEWLSGDIANNYLTVQEGERFSFDSVYYNQSCDAHPPLYYYILHFLSSFFVDEYIEALGFLINLVSYIFLSIFLYKLIYIITKSSFAGVIGVLFNTFTIGAVSMAVYLRMYIMLAMFAVIFAYLNAKIYYMEDCRKNLSTYIELAIITLLGALTHHFFLPYAYLVAAVMFLFYLYKRDWKTLAKYAGFVILGVILSVILFPATLDHMFEIETVEYLDSDIYADADAITNSSFDAIFQHSTLKAIYNSSLSGISLVMYSIRKCFCLLFSDQFGTSIISDNSYDYFNGYIYYVPIILSVLLIIFISIRFIFRKENWLISVKNSVKNTFKRINWFVASLFIAVFLIVILVSAQVDILDMKSFTNRYLFIIYPLFNTLIVSLIYFICTSLFKKRKRLVNTCIVIALSLLLIYENTNYTSIYLWPKSEKVSLLSDVCSNSDVVIVSNANWFLTIYAPCLRNSNQFYFTSYSDLLNNNDEIETYTSDNDMYLLLETGSLTDNVNETDMTYETSIYSDSSSTYGLPNEKSAYLEAVQSLSNTSMCEYIDTVSYFGKYIDIYKLR